MHDIICVVNDTVQRSRGLRAEHGQSFWITTEAGAVLLDTGQSGGVLRHNLGTLALDPQILQALAISHAHYDHTGGLPALAERLAPSLPLYANADLLRARFAQRDDEWRSIGLPVTEDWLRAHFSLHLDDVPQPVAPGVWTTGAITARPHPQGRSLHHVVYNGAGYIADPYRDDLSLVIEVKQGLLLLCGCCHAGLLNTLEHVQRTFARPIVAIVGGTHLGNANASTLNVIAQTIAEWGTVRRIYLNHCSGERAYHTLLHRLGDDVVRPCPAGTIIDIEELL